MAPIAESDGASPVPEAWRRLLERIDHEMRELAAHPARCVVLLPYAQLMPLAARLWAAWGRWRSRCWPGWDIRSRR